MISLLHRKIYRSLMLMAIGSSAVGSLLLAGITGVLMLRLGVSEASDQSAVVEADLIAELTSYQPLYEFERQVQLMASSGKVASVLVSDDLNRVIAASDRSWVGESLPELVKNNAFGRDRSPLLQVLASCLAPSEGKECLEQPSHSVFTGWIPLIGGEQLVSFRSTPIALRGDYRSFSSFPSTAGDRGRGVLVVQTDLRGISLKSSLLALQVFVLALLPLSFTSVLLVLVLRQQMLPTLIGLAQTDSLSGVLNRRAFFEAAEQLMSSRRAGDAPVVVAVIDVDHFKSINDEFGHYAGDEVISQFAEYLLRSVRVSDVVGRLGGDEFALMIADATAHGRAVLQRLVDEVASRDWVLSDGGVLKLSLSVGMATADGTEIDLNALLKKADAALYVAKEQGRCQLVDAGQMSVLERFDAG